MPQASWRVALLSHEGVWESSIYLAMDVYQSANLRQQEVLFSCEILTPTETQVLPFNDRPRSGDSHIGNGVHYDLIVLSHYWGDFEDALQRYPQLPNWLKQQHNHGALISGVNSGIFWAAEAGLLDNLRATSHWRNFDEFRQRYPQVNWTEDQFLVVDNNVYSTNGGNAGMDLTMHLVEKICGRETASRMRRDITYDYQRNYDLTLFNIAGLRQHKDSSIHRAQDWLDQHFMDKVEFDVLADQIGMSRRTLIRRFQKATGDKPTRYLQRLRVESAKHQLINTEDSIKTISLNVGYQDFGYFSSLFKSITELSPRQFRSHSRPSRSEAGKNITEKSRVDQ